MREVEGKERLGRIDMIEVVKMSRGAKNIQLLSMSRCLSVMEKLQRYFKE